ncbi:MAG: hypothetical protein ACLU38_11775 [Dysosmobacter sp.]
MRTWHAAPIYIGVDGEENQGLCTGTENYWCVNAKASEADIQATLDFMNWCVTSEVGTTAMCGGEGAMPSGQPGMGFVIPFQGNARSQHTLVNIGRPVCGRRLVEPVSWNFATMPSEEWKNGVGPLSAYAADRTDAQLGRRGDRLRGRLGRREAALPSTAGPEPSIY